MNSRKDFRAGREQPPGTLRMPTIRIPSDCQCPWKVIVAGPGEQAISQQIHENQLCPRKREHAKLREQQRQEAEASRLGPVA